jgi:hypothetical protein
MIKRVIDVMSGERGRAIRTGVRVPIVDPTDPLANSGRAPQPRPATPLADPTDPRSGESGALTNAPDQNPTGHRPRDEAA